MVGNWEFKGVYGIVYRAFNELFKAIAWLVLRGVAFIKCLSRAVLITSLVAESLP